MNSDQNTGTATTTRWAAKGTTDDVTTCGHCGREDLKGTVRMVALDIEGTETGEEFMGITCAANMTGRKVADLRVEARTADAAQREADRLERERVWDERFAAEQTILDELGLERNFSNMKRVRAILAGRAAA